MEAPDVRFEDAERCLRLHRKDTRERDENLRAGQRRRGFQEALLRMGQKSVKGSLLYQKREEFYSKNEQLCIENDEFCSLTPDQVRV